MFAIAVLYPTMFAAPFQSVSLGGAYFALVIIVVGVLIYALFEGRSHIRGPTGSVRISGRTFNDGMFGSALVIVIVVGLAVYCYGILHSLFLTAIFCRLNGRYHARNCSK
jgi:hypothetical protein